MAISELLGDSSFTHMDILLLQEANSKSVIKIANQFGLNYLYYTISANKSSNSEFSNAILSKNKITEENKLILPHKKQNGRIRNATHCIINIYSIHHMETIIMSRDKRMAQLDAIILDLQNKRHRSCYS
ncbi:MAG: endonuclease/exonuclease/phosphatase family metal-dependent hydrolase [Halioglobus sp.]